MPDPNLMIGDTDVTGSLGITGEIVLDERADHISTPTAAKGILWAKNTTPTTLMFTDDAGTDVTLGAAGAGISDGATLATGLTFPNTGLHILDSNATHDLIIKPGSNLTADRELTITTGDSARTVTLSGDTTLSGTNTGDQTITLTGDVTGTGTGTFGTTIAAGAVDIAMLSATGTPSGTTYLRGDNTWATVAGSGDVSKVGTPVDGQIGVWTGDGTIEGDAGLTFDTTDDTLVIAASGKLGFGAVDILSDSAGTMTLQNIDALDATTEATIEAAIDTLANLTSIQGQTVTVSGTTTISGTNTGDQTITLTGQVTGTGTGSFAATLDKTAITGQSTVTAVGADSILISDASDSGNLKNALVSDILHSPVTVSGTPDYITLSGQDIVRGQIDLTTDVTGDLPLANLAQFSEARIAGRAVGAGTGDLTALTLLQVMTFLNTPVAITSTSNSTAWNSDNGRIFTHEMTENTTIAASSGTPFNGQMVLFRIQKKSTYTLAWNAQFRAGTDFSDTIPTINATADDFHYYLFIYNGTDTAFDLLASTPGN